MFNNDLSDSLEDYLEAIYFICTDKLVAHSNQIAEYLKVGKSSVSWALNQLSGKGLINYAPYEAITLTDKGKSVARRVALRHEAIKKFLTEVLAVDEKTAEANACRLEHVVDKDVLKRMREFMDFLDRCPRGGREWMMGFGYFCRQGQLKDKCPECISDCLHQAQLQTDNQEKPAEKELAELPKDSRERDQVLLQRLIEVQKESERPLSPAQQEIARIFMGTEKHQGLDDIYKQVRKIDTNITLEQVSRTMEILCEHKIARALMLENQTVYEHLHPESHHDHLFCVKCGSIVEFYDPRLEALQMENARRADFRLLRHNLNIFGVCHECIRLESKIRNLSECLTGETVEIVRIVSDKQMQQRIMDMGLVPETVAHILSDNCYGDKMIVLVDHTRIMLESSLARKIRVISVQTDHVEFPHGRRRRRHRHVPDRMDNN
ncbi:MAG: transcriptional repressor [Sedimentisphaerales bacterium]|nr:transcriptional repressor [Sedimentisphaerales bacterium]